MGHRPSFLFQWWFYNNDDGDDDDDDDDDDDANLHDRGISVSR